MSREICLIHHRPDVTGGHRVMTPGGQQGQLPYGIFMAPGIHEPLRTPQLHSALYVGAPI